MSSSNTPNSNSSAAAILGTGSTVALNAAAKASAAKAAAADAGLQDAIAKGYQPARILGGKVVGVWGGALIRTAEGEMRPLKTGDVIKKGDVVLTTQDGIVQIEGAKTTNSALIDRVIADLGTPKPEEPPTAGIQAPGGGDNFLPGLRVDRVVEAVTPAGLGFTEVAGDFEEIQFDTAADERVSDGSEALPDTFTGAEDTPIIFNPITNDTPGNGGPLTVTSIAGQPIAVGSPVTLPQGVVTLNPDGTLTFTPNPNFVGTVSFPYTGANNNGTVTSTVSLTVTPVNDTPDAVNDVQAVIEDTPATGNVLTNDTDPDNDQLSVTGFTVDTNGDGTQEPFTPGQKATLVNAAGKPIGDLTLNANGAFTFNPAKDYVGPVPVVTYSITDGNGGTDSATLTLGPVSPVNDAPEGTDAIRQTYEDVPYVVQTKDFGFKDVDGDVLAAVRIDSLPTNGTLTLNGQPVLANQLISAADIAAGRLRFVPDADENGDPYGSFTFSVQDPSGTFDPVPNRFTLIVDPLAETPAANNDSIKTEEGKPVVIDVLANDKTPVGTTLTVTEINGQPVIPGTPVPITDSTGQPIGSVVVTPDGKVTFTPTPDYQGPVDFTYTATDGKTPVEGKVHVDVTPVNDVPLAADDKATVETGKPTTLDVLGNDTDPDKDPLTISEINGQPVTPGTPVELKDPVTGQPVGTVTVTPEGKITFNPAPGVEGPVTFEYTVKDPSGATDKATVTLDVGGVNDAPVAQADVGSTTEDAVLTVSAANGVIQSAATPAGRDSDVDGDTLAVSTVSFGATAGKVGSPIAGAWGSLTLNADGSYSYVPNAAAQGLDTGESQSDVFTYTVTDPAGKTATTTLTITVTGVNDGPVAIDDSALTPVGTPVTIPVLSNDTDPDGEPLTVTEVDGKPISPGNPVSLVDPVGNPIGTVALNPDGTLTFTPAPGYEGPVDFPYTVTDGTTTDTGNVHVVVSSTNRPPVADDNFVQGIEGTPVTFDPRSNDYDPDTDPIAITQINGKPITVGAPVTLPEGTVALNPDGTLTFTPAKNFDGPVTFEYTIADGRSGTDTAKVTIEVAPLDNSPAANDDVATTPEDTPVLVDVLANDKDLDGEPLTITEIDGKPAVVGTPVTITDDKGTPIATVTLTPEGKLNVVPAPNYNGPIEFPYTVTDGDTPVEATVTVNVTPVNDAPVANDDKATVPGDTPTTLDVLGNDTDPDKDPLTISEINGQPVTPGTPVELKDPVTGQPVGTVTVTPEGKITFNPAPGVEGPVTFEYTVKDPSGATDKATVTLDVGGVNDAPVAQADVGSTTEDAVLTVSAANGVIQSSATPAGRDSDVDGDTLAVSTVSFGATAGKVGSPIAGAFGTLTLNADGSYSYVPNAAAQSLDTGESESDVFTYTVTDPAGKTATTTLTITVTGVNDGPVAIDDSALTPVGTPVTIPVLSNDTDPDGEPLTVTEVDGKPISPGNPVSLVDPVGNPIGTVALNPDGTLTFTPAPGYEGPVDFPYTVTDGTTTDTGNVHVVVSSTNRPPVADDNFVQGIEGTPVTFDPRSNDYDPDTDPIAITQINGKPITVGAPVTLPEGTVALNPDGTLTFTPAKNFDGPVTFEYTIADGRSGTDTAKVTIEVAPLDNSPAANDDVATTPEDTPVLVDVLANDKDLDGEPLTITEIDGKPAVVGTPVTITDDQGTPIATVTLTPEGKLNVVPAPNYTGPIEFPYTVTDGDTPVEATVTVNVTPVNDAPVANDDKATVPGDTPTTLDVLGNDTDPDKDPLTISEINGQPVTPGTPVELKDPVTGQPVGTVTVTPEGKITFNPAPGVEGPVTFEYTVKDPSGATDKATVTLDVGGVNDAPVAQADVGSTTEDAVLTVSAANGVIQSAATPAGRDSDVDGDTLAVSTVSFGATAGKVGSPIAGAFGTLTLNADGSYSYVPNAAAQALDTGESESDVFTYTVTDPAGKTATTTLTITVTGVNDGPVAIDDSALTPVGTPVTIPVLTNDTDPDGEPLTVTEVDGKPISPGNPVSLTDPVGNPIGTVALNPDGTLTFTPAPGYEGPVDFPYTVTDGTTTDTANVHIVVSDKNRPPQAGDNVVDGLEDTPVTFDPRSNDFDPDTDPLTITEINGQPIEPGQSVDLPQGKVSMNPDGTLTFTPKDNFTGPVTFDYTVEDGRGGSDVAQVNINVANTNDLPEGTDATRGTAEDTAYVLKTDDFGFKDVDGDTFAGVRIDKLPTAGTLTLNGQPVSANQFVSAQDIADGKLKYVPGPDENGRPYGSFDFSVQDSKGSFDAKPNTFTLNVGELDDSPSAVNDTATTREDTAVLVDVLKNDSDPDKEDTLSIVAIEGQRVVVGQPVNISKDGVVIATVTLTAEGKLNVLPAPNYNTDGKDPITFNYTITDGRTEVSAKVEVVVTPVNDGPDAVDDKATIAEDAPQVLKLVDNDSDPDDAKADLKITNIAGQEVKPGDVVTIRDENGNPIATVILNPNGQDVTVDPVDNFNGPVTFGYTLSDPQGLKDTANVTVDVGGVNDAPEARPDVGATDEDITLTVSAANGVIQSGLNAAGKDTDVDGDSLSVSAVAFGNVVGRVGEALQGQYGALTLNADGSYSFVPNSTANALDDGESGQDVFTYTVTDPGGKTSTTSLTINVTGRNDGPVAIDDSGKTDEDKPVTLNLIANDKDDDGEPLTITQINGQNVSSGQVVPVNDDKGTKIGDLLINGDGTVTFTPVQDYNGPVDFKYTVSDGTATDEGAVHIDVGAGNDAPTARDDLVQGQEDKTVTFDPVTPNDTDPDKDPLTITQVAGKPISVGNPVTVPEGKVELNPDGTLSFTPNKDFNGPVTFTYTISDGNGGTSTANINLDIKSVNDNPDAVNDTKAVTEDTPATGNVLDNDTDVDKDKLSVTGFTIDTNGDGTPESFNPGQKANLVNAAGKPIGDLTINADGSFTFNPAKDYFGPVPVATYAITDGQGGTDSATLTLGDVTPVADTPEGTNATKTTAEDTAYGVTAADFGFKDVDGDTFAGVRIDTLATNGVLKLNGVAVTLGQEISIADINAGKLQFVPDANENGAPYGSFTFSVKDSSGAFDVAPNTLTLNVTAQADTPTGADITKTTNEDTPYVIGKADFGFADVDGDTFKAIRVDTLPTNGTLTLNGVLVTAGQVITVADLDAGNLKFVPDANENGTPYGNFTFSVQDSTNAFDAAPNTFTLNVTAVPDTPEGADATRTTKESTPYTVAANDFGFSDADGDTFAGVRIDTLATNGVLKLNGVAVTLGQEISIADINAGKLQFVPDANENGSPYATFTFSVKDSSGAFDVAPNTLTFNVTDVANVPDGTDVAKTTNEDTPYTIVKADFGFKDVDAGDSLKAVRVDTLPTNGTLTLNGVAVTAGQVISSADIDAGKLKFVPDANENGTPYGSFTFSVQDSSDLFDTAPNTFTLNVTPVADTPEGTDATKTTAEDTAYGVTAADFGFKDVDGDTFAGVRIDTLATNGVLKLNGVAVTVGQEISIADINAGKLQFVPDANENGTPYGSFTFSVKDSSGAFDLVPNTLTLNVTAQADTPTGADITKTTNEDTSYVIGKADFGFADVDGDTFKAVRVDTLPTNGTLTLNGVLVTAGQVITVADLDAGKLKFVPDANENGTPYGNFTFSVQDSTNAFDAAPNTFTLNVTAVADTPEGTDATKTTAEDTPYGVTAADFGFKDVDGDTFAGVRIDTLATNGVLKLNGVAVTLGQEISIADINAGKLQFVPDANENGAPYGSFTFSVKDSSGAFDLVPNTLTLNVTAVADTPTGADITKTTAEDTPYVIGKADFGFADVDGDTFKAVRVDTLPTNGTLTLNGVLVTAGQVITVADLDAGNLKFVPDANENGTPYGNFTFSVQDSTNAFDAAPNTFTLNVTAVADTPEGTDATKTTAEDTAYGVTAADFGFKDVDGDTFAGVRIDTLATNGVLKLNGVAVTLGQEISIADINAGKLQFVPDANENGAPYGSFTFSVKDSSGAFDAAPNTFTLNVSGGNDTPTGADTTKTTNEDTPYTIAKADFGFADADGDTFNAVRVDTLPTNGTLTLNGVLVTAGQVITVADLDAGKLKFVPDANENGTPYGNFTFSVQDSTGAFDTAPNTFTLNVTPVADTPEGTDATKTTAEDTPYGVTAADFGFKDVDGDTFAAVRIDTLATNGVLKLNGVAVTLGQEISIADINAGKLQFVPDANENGAPYGSFTFSVKDSSGAFDLVPNTLTLNVTAVADTPTGTNVTKTTNEDTPYTIGKADFGFGDVDGDTFKAVRIDTLPTNGTLTLNGVAVTAGQIIAVANIDLNQLKFVPDANENGTPYGNFTFSVQDSSDTFDLAPNTFTLNVTPVADTPDSANVTRTTSEDINYAVKLADFAFSDGDGDTFQSVVITTLPTDGKLLLNGVAIAAGAEVTVAQLNAGNLVFAPDLHESNTPYATFTFQVKDSTGALDATPNTFTMNVTAVPDAPTLAVANKSFSIAENFESVNLGGTYFKNIDPTTLTGGIWRTDNKAVGTNPKSVEIAEFANTTWYGATSNGTNGTRAIELEQNPGDRSNLFTEFSVEKGEVFSLSFDAAARQRNNGTDITNKTSVFYVYWEGQLVYTFNSQSGTFTNFQLDLVATQTGTAKLEFIAADSDSFGGFVDNIKVDLRQNTGVQGYVVNVPDLTAGLVDKDGSETLALRVEAIPVGAVLTDGVNSFTSAAGATTATITGWDLAKLSLLPPAAFSGTIDLNVVATATETSNNTSVSTSKQVQLTVLADANNQYGAAADDTLAGTVNADRLWGFEGNDRLSGAAGNDTVIGGLGNDTLAGDDGNDLIDGAIGTDSLTGGLGIDTLQGGKGNDTLSGNDGNDVFRWSLDDGGTNGAPARDVITDFSTSAVGGDILDLRDLLQGEEVSTQANIQNFIDIDTTSVAGQTVLRISSTGGFTNGVYDAAKEDQSITLSNINLRTALGLASNATDQAVLEALFARKQLIIDGL